MKISREVLRLYAWIVPILSLVAGMPLLQGIQNWTKGDWNYWLGSHACSGLFVHRCLPDAGNSERDFLTISQPCRIRLKHGRVIAARP
jgi:hypothetical protein